MTGAPDDVLRSHAFQTAMLQSERRRIMWTISALAVIVAIVIVRDLVTDYQESALHLLLSVGLGVVAICYELFMLRLVTGHIRDETPVPEITWKVNVLAESAFPSAVLVVATLMPTVGPYRALSIPAVSLYFIAIILSTLRLRPLMCTMAGVISAGGYTLVTAATFLLYSGHDAGTAAFHPAVYATGAALLLIAGNTASAVAGQIREHVVRAIEEARERQRVQLEARNTLIFGLAKLAEYRDTDTGAHLERISAYAAELAKALRDHHDVIDDEWIETLAVAASMHDIGKVGVPDGVLLKPGRLDDDERKVIETHPGIGAETLDAIRAKSGRDPLLDMSSEIAIGHHERWDGNGYPHGVEGDSIALAARIISVADVYDALTSPRVYKPPFGHEKAAAIIREGRGTQFDPRIVDAFDRVEPRFDEIRARYQDVGPQD